jgi:hypothetical protein
MSDPGTSSDAETMSEEEIGRVVIGGRARAACPQTPKSLKEVKIKKSRVRPVRDVVFWMVFFAPADRMTLARN